MCNLLHHNTLTLCRYQEDDRAFDKSEMSTHREELALADYAARGLASITCVATTPVLLHYISPHLSVLTNTQDSQHSSVLPNGQDSQQSCKHSQASSFPVADMVKYLTEEITSICDSIKEFSPSPTWELTIGNTRLLKLYKVTLLCRTLIRSSNEASCDHQFTEVSSPAFSEICQVISKLFLQTSLVQKIGQLAQN